MKDTIIGVDLAKRVFQLHGATMTGHVTFRKKLTREQFRRFMAEHPPCMVVFEACGSASYWAREMAKLGHDAKLIAPQYVKPFVKRQKNDGEAGSWPQMRPRKPVERCRGDRDRRAAARDAVRLRQDRRSAGQGDVVSWP
jgi:transposase